MSLPQQSQPIPRTTSASVMAGRQVRQILGDVVAPVESLRNRLVFIRAKAERRPGEGEAVVLRAQCDEIEAAIGQLRTTLIVHLMDSPRAVTGHSRVVDMEKAIDSLERALSETRRALRKN